jgi:hypothetical protein
MQSVRGFIATFWSLCDFNCPGVLGLVPGHSLAPGLEHSLAVKAVLCAQRLDILSNLMSRCIPMLWYVFCLLEKRKVDVALYIAHQTRISVPVPTITSMSAYCSPCRCVITHQVPPKPPAGSTITISSTESPAFNRWMKKRIPFTQSAYFSMATCQWDTD